MTHTQWRVGDAGHTIFGPKRDDGKLPEVIAAKLKPEHARLIVRAVRSHDELLAALQEAKAIIIQHDLLSDGPDYSRIDLQADRIATLKRLFDWTNGSRLRAIAKSESP